MVPRPAGPWNPSWISNLARKPVVGEAAGGKGRRTFPGLAIGPRGRKHVTAVPGGHRWMDFSAGVRCGASERNR